MFLNVLCTVGWQLRRSDSGCFGCMPRRYTSAHTPAFVASKEIKSSPTCAHRVNSLTVRVAGDTFEELAADDGSEEGEGGEGVEFPDLPSDMGADGFDDDS